MRGLVEQSEGGMGLKRKRRDTPWLSRRAEDPSGRRANLNEAKNAARRLRERRSRKLPIEDLFEANSSKEATAARRRTVKRIMDTLEADFPLTSRTLMEVASSLKMAGYKAGVNYLGQNCWTAPSRSARGAWTGVKAPGGELPKWYWRPG